MSNPQKTLPPVEEDELYKGWGVLELFGQKAVAGFISEQTRFGGVVGQIEILYDGHFHPRMFGARAVYRITPTTETAAKRFMAINYPDALQDWGFHLPLPPEGGTTK